MVGRAALERTPRTSPPAAVLHDPRASVRAEPRTRNLQLEANAQIAMQQWTDEGRAYMEKSSRQTGSAKSTLRRKHRLHRHPKLHRTTLCVSSPRNHDVGHLANELGAFPFCSKP
jgi:hypothetical protein